MRKTKDCKQKVLRSPFLLKMLSLPRLIFFATIAETAKATKNSKHTKQAKNANKARNAIFAKNE